MPSQPAAELAPKHRAGVVAIVGRPNVGKSTLLNRLVGAKISIVSGKPQTTRRRITGIVTRENAQIVLVDTPGYQTEHDSALNRLMNRNVRASLRDVQAVIWMVEALRFDRRDEEVGDLLPGGVPLVLAVNKIDRVRDKNLLLPFIAALSARYRFEAIVPVSARRGAQVEVLLDAVVPLLAEAPPSYGEDELTTVSERVLAAELIREKLFHRLGDELPYAATVEIERFAHDKGVRRINATILVEKEGHRPIVIGRSGARLKTIAAQARRDMERLFGGKVFLEVWVKVRRGWTANEGLLRRLGIGD